MPEGGGPIQVFESVCEDPYRVAREAAAGGRSVAGYLCTYTPEELFHAAGCFPVRIFGRDKGATYHADAHLPSFACGFLRSVLDMALAGELDFLEVVVFPHTCDTMQNLAEIWKHSVARIPSITITTPVSVGTEPAVRYFSEEIRRARKALEETVGEVSDSLLMKSIALYGAHRERMHRLYEVRRAHPERLSGRQMMATVIASLLMPREEHLPHLDALLAELGGVSGQTGDDRPTVFVVGNTCHNLDYVSMIEDAGCVVVEDDLCSGYRAFAMAARNERDPIDRLARMYLVGTSCPTKHQPGWDTGKDLVEKAQALRAEGVVFLLTKFCEPWGFDYPHLKEAFEGAGLPTLLAAIECNQPPGESFRGRISAFIEMLQTKS